MNPRSSTSFDVALGRRIKSFRLFAGMSQSDLGAALGLTFQQVQKYEKGTNKVAGGRLVEIATTLKTTPQALLASPATVTGNSEHDLLLQFMATRDGVDLARAFMAVPDKQKRAAIVNLAQLLSA